MSFRSTVSQDPVEMDPDQFFHRLSGMMEMYYDRLSDEFDTRMTGFEIRANGLEEIVNSLMKIEPKVSPKQTKNVANKVIYLH